MSDKKEKPRCKNCGDKTVFGSNCPGDRSHKGWCVPCYTQWKRYSRQGGEYWVEPQLYRSRDAYAGRGTHPSKDSP